MKSKLLLIDEAALDKLKKISHRMGLNVNCFLRMKIFELIKKSEMEDQEMTLNKNSS